MEAESYLVEPPYMTVEGGLVTVKMASERELPERQVLSMMKASVAQEYMSRRAQLRQSKKLFCFASSLPLSVMFGGAYLFKAGASGVAQTWVVVGSYTAMTAAFAWRSSRLLGLSAQRFEEMKPLMEEPITEGDVLRLDVAQITLDGRRSRSPMMGYGACKGVPDLLKKFRTHERRRHWLRVLAASAVAGAATLAML